MMYLHFYIRSVLVPVPLKFCLNLSGYTGNVYVHVRCSVAVGIHDLCWLCL